MPRTIAHLIDTQMKGEDPGFQYFPYWFTDWVGFDNLQEWLIEVWGWAADNACRSHQERPWHPANLNLYRCNQDGTIPF